MRAYTQETKKKRQRAPIRIDREGREGVRLHILHGHGLEVSRGGGGNTLAFVTGSATRTRGTILKSP